MKADQFLQTHEDIMNAILKRYNANLFPDKPSTPTKAMQGPEARGLERVAKDLIKFSNGRFHNELSGVIAPERKLVVMIIGNHSAGKSSFINWYVGEDIQKAKVSIETIDITLVMHGRHKQEVNGYNAIKMLPSLKELIEGK